MRIVELDDVSQKTTKHTGVFAFNRTGRGNIDRVLFKVGHAKIAQQHSAVRV